MYHVPPHFSLSILLLRQGLTSSLEEKHISREVSIRKSIYDLYCDLSVITSKKISGRNKANEFICIFMT